MKEKFVCTICRQRVNYKISKRHVKEMIADITIEYDEYFGTCNLCNSEIFIPDLLDKNTDLREQEYRKKKLILTVGKQIY